MGPETTIEARRLAEARESGVPWKRWGPYLSERQWGTVREDYSESGDAWGYFTHDQARSRAYRWGEDGLAGISDDKQRLCFALALWNGRDPILKERLFGLTNSEGNHGEDVKEYYFYLDSTPTHSYMKYLYKYPQAAFPYAKLIDRAGTQTRGSRVRADRYRVFDQIGISTCSSNMRRPPRGRPRPDQRPQPGPEQAALHVLPAMWFRNTRSPGGTDRPTCAALQRARSTRAVRAVHPVLGEIRLSCDAAVPLLFTENETNTERIFGVPNRAPYLKDGINDYVVQGKPGTLNPELVGTKVAAHYRLDVEPGECRIVRLRISAVAKNGLDAPSAPGFEEILRAPPRGGRRILPIRHSFLAAPRCRERDATGARGNALDEAIYAYDVDNKWPAERRSAPFAANQKASPRNEQWHHMYNGDVLSMPDKWEYPWYAAWDLAFQVLALGLVDLDFSKEQLRLMLREHYMHPNGQIPAYECNFGYVNPPVNVCATIFTYRLERRKGARATSGG
jgi:hypothetical protein